MVNVVTISVNAGTFSNLTPGVMQQIRNVLVRETTKQIRYVQMRQPGEEYVVKVDDRWGAPITNAQWRIQAFWAYPANTDILKKIWALIQEETYKFPKRRTGHLLNSWRISVKSARQRQLGGGPGSPTTSAFPPMVEPGSGYTFINEATYGSLMSRWSAIMALRGSIAKAAKRGRIAPRRITALTRSVFYHNTPKGYSTVARIAKRARQFATKSPVLIRAFDIAPSGGTLKRVSGVTVAFLRGVTITDIRRQGRG